MARRVSRESANYFVSRSISTRERSCWRTAVREEKGGQHVHARSRAAKRGVRPLVGGFATKANCDARANRVANGNKPILRRNTQSPATACPFPVLALSGSCHRQPHRTPPRSLARPGRALRSDDGPQRRGPPRFIGLRHGAPYASMMILN